MRKHFCLFLLASIFYSYRETVSQNASATMPMYPDMYNDPGGRYFIT